MLPQQDVEAALDRILMVGGPRRLNQLRDHAREIAPFLGYEAQFKRLNTIIGALLGYSRSKNPDRQTGPRMRRRPSLRSQSHGNL